MTQQPVLSIIVVNSDGCHDTLQCIESIIANPPSVDFEVVVVDNCSRQPCLPIIEQQYPTVRTYMAARRQGFAKNYNSGIRQALGEYVLVLNNDTLVHPSALDALLHTMRQNPSYGMVGPRLTSSDGSVQTVCARQLLTPASYVWTQLITDLGLPTGKLWDRYLQWRLARRPSGPVPCISGAAMLLRTDDLATIGLLDETYDFYYEDVEWCHRVQQHGKDVVYVADAVITHLGDQSLSKVKVWAKQSEYKSALRYFSQYYTFSQAWRWTIWWVTVVGFFVRAMAFLAVEARTKRLTHARAYLYLWQWVIQQRPGRS